MAEAFIVDAVRTPIGRFRGALKSVRPDDLAAHVLSALLARNALDGARVDEVFLGCANQAGEDNRNVARMALLLAGLPDTVPGVTVNRLCASGLEAVIQGCRMIRVGEADIVLAGGVESMTRAPWSMAKPDEGFPFGKREVWDTALGWRYPNKRLAALFPLDDMGETAERVAERWGLSQEAQDAYALGSHQKALAAQAAGRFANELVAVEVPQSKGSATRVEVDEGPRADTTLEKLARLKPAFVAEGTVTAGNSSTLNDGASAVLLMSEAALKATGATPLARYVSSASVGVDPRYMGIGPVTATQKALARAGWNLDSVDLVELNEAFASQVLACARELKLSPERLNVNGGGLALGHPLGSSGARILTTLVHELKRRDAHRGLATLCVGVGQGLAMTVER
ncbi:thiolase family protein [Corallococcus terminator]